MELRGFLILPALALGSTQGALYDSATLAGLDACGSDDLLHALACESVQIADLFERQPVAVKLNHPLLAGQIVLAVIGIHAVILGTF